MNGFELRRSVLNEEIDYLQLMSLLSSYSQPRAKIKQWLQDGTLIRVKKGLYVFGPKVAQQPFSKEILANLIYGPSAISLEYALSFYGMIPERVETVTSITPLRDKNFSTPVGNFSYRYLSQSKFSVGITQTALNNTHSVFIATPEKALIDLLFLIRPSLIVDDLAALKDFLLNDLRIDEEKLYTLNVDKLNAISIVYKNSSCKMLSQLIMQENNERNH